jgi:hypothetical protein
MVNAAPNPECVGNVARWLLQQDDPDAAADMMLKILDAIAGGLAAQGWPELAAHRFACDFGRTVNHVLAAARDRRVSTLH